MRRYVTLSREANPAVVDALQALHRPAQPAPRWHFKLTQPPAPPMRAPNAPGAALMDARPLPGQLGNAHDVHAAMGTAQPPAAGPAVRVSAAGAHAVDAGGAPARHALAASASPSRPALAVSSPAAGVAPPPPGGGYGGGGTARVIDASTVGERFGEPPLGGGGAVGGGPSLAAARVALPALDGANGAPAFAIRTQVPSPALGSAADQAGNGGTVTAGAAAAVPATTAAAAPATTVVAPAVRFDETTAAEGAATRGGGSNGVVERRGEHRASPVAELLNDGGREHRRTHPATRPLPGAGRVRVSFGPPAAAPTRTDDDLAAMEQLLKAMQADDYAADLLLPVDAVQLAIPDYHTIVKQVGMARRPE